MRNRCNDRVCDPGNRQSALADSNMRLSRISWAGCPQQLLLTTGNDVEQLSAALEVEQERNRALAAFEVGSNCWNSILPTTRFPRPSRNLIGWYCRL